MRHFGAAMTKKEKAVRLRSHRLFLLEKSAKKPSFYDLLDIHWAEKLGF
jgi:hypothetical protein